MNTTFTNKRPKKDYFTEKYVVDLSCFLGNVFIAIGVYTNYMQ